MTKMLSLYSVRCSLASLPPRLHHISKIVTNNCHYIRGFTSWTSLRMDYTCSNHTREFIISHRKSSFAVPQTTSTEDLQGFYAEIKQLLHTNIYGLKEMCCYYFDGRGKSFRPTTVFLMSRACNYHTQGESFISGEQRKVAIISEMIHIGSLIHDDVVDVSNIRRGKSSVNSICGDRNAVLAGNYIVSNASKLLASIDDEFVISIISQVVDDLVRGEFMQQDNRDHFNHYLKKTYKKTASLIANCCKAASHLGQCNDAIVECSFQFGRNIGIAFQLVDDLLDFVATTEMLGKPSAADLRLGLATAPVFFACGKFPVLHEMITRRFQKPGDVDYALWAVSNSDALDETRLLASQYCNDALNNLNNLRDSPETEALNELCRHVLERSR